MVIQEMTEDECRDMLSRASFGRLACARDNQPYVVPIYFAYDGRDVYGFSTPGQKIEWMRSNPLVCLQTDEQASHNSWTSVIVTGRYEEVLDAPEFDAARSHAHEVLEKHAAWWGYAAVAAAEWRRKPGKFSPVFYRIQIDQISGHRAVPQPS